MEHNGINLDVSALAKFSEELTEKIAGMETAVYSLAGMEFNMNSPKQLGEALFDLLKLVEKPKA